MDDHLILEFDTLQEAQACLGAINALAAVWWQTQGYTVIDGKLIGKNALTGEDEPNSQVTTTWAEILENGEKYYFYSPSNNPRFPNWKEELERGLERKTGKDIGKMDLKRDWKDGLENGLERRTLKEMGKRLEKKDGKTDWKEALEKKI